MTIGFYPGSFDLCHAGHMLAFKEARQHCKYLIVGLQSNPNNDRKHKNIPIMSMEERRIILNGIKYIDEIQRYDTEVQVVALVKELKPSIYFIGEDWKNKEFSAQKTCLELGIKIHYLSRNHAYASSTLRKKIYAAERESAKDEKKRVYNKKPANGI